MFVDVFLNIVSSPQLPLVSIILFLMFLYCFCFHITCNLCMQTNSANLTEKGTKDGFGFMMFFMGHFFAIFRLLLSLRAVLLWHPRCEKPEPGIHSQLRACYVVVIDALITLIIEVRVIDAVVRDPQNF